MSPEDYVGWLYAVDHTLAEIIDQQSGTLEDENFMIDWWNDIREGFDPDPRRW